MVSSKLRGALLIAAMLLAVTAGADDAPPAAKPLDDATLASLGIDPGDVETNDGSWSWTSGAYSYDGSGNIKAIGTQTYAYDIRGRLVNATMTRPDQPGSQVHTYSYDAAGNMVSRTAVTTTPIPMPTSITTNHLTGLGAVYDEAGNVTELQPPRQSATYQYTFDALGALQRMQVYGTSTPRYNVYTADDERLWTYDGATNTSRWTIRDLAGKVLRDYTYDFVPTSTPGVSAPRWRLSRDYIYRDGLLLAAVTPTETLHFSLDHLGTPRVITNANRYKVGFHHYLPFGEEWLVNPQPTDTEPQKYTGHERDRDLAGGTASTDYMHARHYVGGVGRFLSIDPVLQVRRAMTSSQMWNRYSYAANNPLKYVDPTGKVVVLPADCDNARTTCRALSDLRNTVPVELRMFVRATTKDGQTTLDARYLNMMADASSKNFQRLRILGNS
ncbi:MAG TPA: RHS repeat-associated core domain-containing protein, partial [Thermoanaerobaculia bacterium]